MKGVIPGVCDSLTKHDYNSFLSVLLASEVADLYMFGLKLMKFSVIFTHMKLWVAVARQNLKRVKIVIIYFSVGLILLATS